MSITLTLTVSSPEVAKRLIDLAATPAEATAPAALITYPQQTQAPIQVPTTPAAPVVPVQPQAPAPVPTTAQTYTLEQLSVAATPLIDAGRREEVLALVHSFGVQALTQLPKEQYGAFATALRALGAKI